MCRLGREHLDRALRRTEWLLGCRVRRSQALAVLEVSKGEGREEYKLETGWLAGCAYSVDLLLTKEGNTGIDCGGGADAISAP